MGNFKEDIAKIKAFVFDVDGVLTDGGIVLTNEGDFIRRYNAKDGYAMAYALECGYKVGIITGGYGDMMHKKFNKMMGVTSYCSNCHDKLVEIKRFMKEHSLDPEQVLYMGDDIPDLDAMRHVGIPVSPADAAIEIIEASRYVSQFNGGYGCVRDVIEQTLRSQGMWAKHTNGLNFAQSK